MKQSNAVHEKVFLPDGSEFPFWDDRTVYRACYHVAAGQPHAVDTNPGTAARPFRTIGRAAEMLQPGEKVIVHAGVYRECVVPRQGGTGPEQMIAYETAPGETVVVSGAVEWRPRCQSSAGWQSAATTQPIWMADLPVEDFGGYNPFLARNIYEEFLSYRNLDDAPKYLLRRGAVFVNGRPLRQVTRYAALAEQAGAFWVEEPGRRIHFRLVDDADPAAATFEVTAQEQLFAPDERGLGYIRVSGFVFERAADGVPVPQRAMVSASRGHHWIIEHNVIRWANACGLDVGQQDWKAAKPAKFGGHIIRGNRISDCGVCGIAGCQFMDHTLVEDNVVERVGGLGLELMWEVAGLKFHVAKHVLIRRNTFRDLDRACGVWLDFMNQNCRVTGNLFHNIVSCHGAAFVELTADTNLIDHNVFWEVRISAAFGDNARNGTAVNADNSNRTIIAHNFIAHSAGFGVMLNAFQEERRQGECHDNRVLNNIFCACPRRVFLGHNHSNQSDGNLFDAANAAAVCDIQQPAPEPKPVFVAWQHSFGQDRQSVESPMTAEWDQSAGKLRFSCRQLPATVIPVPELQARSDSLGCGPFAAAACNRLRAGETVVWSLEKPGLSASEVG